VKEIFAQLVIREMLRALRRNIVDRVSSASMFCVLMFDMNGIVNVCI